MIELIFAILIGGIIWRYVVDMYLYVTSKNYICHICGKSITQYTINKNDKMYCNECNAKRAIKIKID